MMDWILEHARVIALVFFFVAFSLVLLRTYWPGSREKYQSQADIPLRDNDTDTKD